MRLKTAIEEKTFDVRVLEKNRAKQLVTEKEFQKHLKSLQDDSANLTEVDLTQPDPAYPNIKGPVMVDGRIIKHAPEATPVAEPEQPPEMDPETSYS